MKTTTLIISSVIMLIVVIAVTVLAFYYDTVFPDPDEFPDELQQNKEIPFQELKKGQYNEIKEKQGIVIKSTEEWASLWTRMFPTEMIASAIDFNNNTVIAVFQGEKNNGGYSIQIAKIIDKGSYVEVIARETSPARGAITIQVITQPYHIVITGKITKEVRFTFV